MDVYVWHNIPSHHSAPALRRLAEVWPGRVCWVCHQASLPERLRMGWKAPELGNVNLVILNGEKAKADDIIARSLQDIHIVAALERKFDTLPYAMRVLHNRGCRNLGIFAESGDTRGVRGRLRFLLHMAKARRYRSRVKVVLSLGSLGVEYFTRVGFDRSTVFPYAYQIDDEAPEPKPPSTPRDDLLPIRLIYVGQLIHLKGVDVLLKALDGICGHDWRLTVVGEGPEEGRLKRLAAAPGLEGRVQWLGSVPSEQVGGLLRQHDVCVCPSRYDGWCMVVSEALYAGIGVITTEAVGARDVVRASGAGRVVRPNSVSALREVLEDLLRFPERVERWKAEAERYRPRLGGRAAGDYLRQVLQCVFEETGHRPQEPWLPNER